MTLLRLAAWLWMPALSILGYCAAWGQDYPSKPIRIVAIGPGGVTDLAARIIAQGIAGPLGQQVIVDNRPNGVIPGDIVAKSPPDGYTLLVAGGTLWIGPLLQKTPYDPVRDFAPISLTNSAPNLLVVHPSLPVKTVKELVALAKARPGALNYSSAGTGVSSHLAAELFKHLAGVNIVGIPYKTASSRMASLVGGEVQLEFATAGSVASYVKSKKLNALAVTSAKPSPLFPGLPSIAESGVPGYVAVQTGGMFAPTRTPEPIVNRLNQEVVRFLNTAPAKEHFAQAGIETVGSTPEQFAAVLKSEIARLGKVIKDAGIKAE